MHITNVETLGQSDHGFTLGTNVTPKILGVYTLYNVLSQFGVCCNLHHFFVKLCPYDTHINLFDIFLVCVRILKTSSSQFLWAVSASDKRTEVRGKRVKLWLLFFFSTLLSYSMNLTIGRNIQGDLPSLDFFVFKRGQTHFSQF